MTRKEKKPAGHYAVGKGRPPEWSRWKKSQSGNPKGATRRAPDEAGLIERLFRRRIKVIERGETVLKSGFAIIHAQLLNKEGAGSRRAGRTRDRYEAFARADADAGGVLLRFIDSDPVPPPGPRDESASVTKSSRENSESLAGRRTEGGS